MLLSICTYNCNGLASVKQYASNNTLVGVLQQLGADIVCFQETKLSRGDLWPVAFQRIAEVPGWDACFCFTRKSGYSGVATYSRSAVTTVRAAEEGLLRVLPPQNPVCAATKHVADSATAAAGAGAQAAPDPAVWPKEIVFPAEQLRAMFTAEEALAVDKDGRCIITDHGLFVLFNCYFPACTGNNALQQLQVKRNMWRAVEVRMRALLASGRHVILAGDFNVSLPWWGQEGSTGATTIRLGCLSTKAAARLQAQQGIPAAQLEQQPGQQRDSTEQEQQRQQAVGQASHGPEAEQAAGSGCGVEGLPAHLQQQPGVEDVNAQQPAQQLMGVSGGAKEGNKFAPHAQYTRGKPVLPSSGLAEALIALTTPAEAGRSAASGSALPTAGVLVDTLKHLNPGVQKFRHWDQRKGQYKERLPYTAWSPMYNIRNDQTGARSDYIFVADAAEYAGMLQRLPEQQQTTALPTVAHGQGQQPVASLAPHLPPPPQQQWQLQQHALQQEAFSIFMRAALSSAFILRELRWTDHAPVVLQLQLLPNAARLLRSPAADAALQAVTPQPQPQLASQPRLQPSGPPPPLQPQPQLLQQSRVQPQLSSNSQLQQLGLQSQPQLQPQQQSQPLLQSQQHQQAPPAPTAPTGTSFLPSQHSAHEHPTNSQAAPASAHGPATPSPSGVPAELPCPLSSYWLLQPAAAAATASAVLAAAGVDRVPTAVLTCSTIHELRESQYAAATAAIAARAEELYAAGGGSVGAAQDTHAASLSSAPAAPRGVDPTGGVPGCAAFEAAVALGLASPALQHAPGAAGESSVPYESQVSAQPSTQPLAPLQQQGTQQHNSAGAAGHGTATQGVPHLHRHPKQQGQQQHMGTKQRGQQQQQGQLAKGGPLSTPAVCGKRKGRGWKVVRMGNGRTATVACSSSDSEG